MNGGIYSPRSPANYPSGGGEYYPIEVQRELMLLATTQAKGIPFSDHLKTVLNMVLDVQG